MTPFALSERDIWPGCREIEVEGELDLAVSERLRAALERAMTERHHVLIDLSRCDFLDLHALTAMIRAHWGLQARGRQLLLYGARGQVRRLLSVTAAAETGLSITASIADASPTSWSDWLRKAGEGNGSLAQRASSNGDAEVDAALASAALSKTSPFATNPVTERTRRT